MKRGWSWLLSAWARLTGARGRTFRLLFPEQAQAPGVTTTICAAEPPIEVPASLPEKAQVEAVRIRRQFESGAYLKSLTRSLPAGAACRLQVRETFAGKTNTHLVVVSPSLRRVR